MSGFKQILLKLDQIHYDIINDTNHKTNVNTNTPILINVDDINNTYHGYRSHEEMESYICSSFIMTIASQLEDF